MTARDRFPAHDREYHRMLNALERAEADADRLAEACRVWDDAEPSHLPRRVLLALAAHDEAVAQR